MENKFVDPQVFLAKAIENHEAMKDRRKRGDRKVIFDESRGLYVGQLSFTDSVTGKRERPKVYGKTEKEARVKMRALEKEIEEGLNPIRGKHYTVKTWVEHYYENYRKHSNLAIKTLESEKLWIDLHIVPGLGNIKLSKLKTDTIQTFYRLCLERSTEKGGPLAPQSVHHIHGVLKRALRKAVELKYIHFNPIDNVELPRMGELMLRAMSREQIDAFIKIAAQREFRYLPSILLALTTGLRRSEIFGLRWQDIDMDRRVIRVRQVLLTTEQGIIIESRTKTKESRNAVAIPASLVEELKRHRTQQELEKQKALQKAEEDRQKFGEEVNSKDYYEENDLVFRQENGRRVDPHAVLRSFGNLLREAKLPHFRLHDLRHTFVSLLIESGVHAKKVQMASRHASIDQTMDRYGHLFSPISGDTADALDDIIPLAIDTPKQDNIEEESPVEKSDSKSD